MGTIEDVAGNIGNIAPVKCQFMVLTWSLLDVDSTIVDGESPCLDLHSQISFWKTVLQKIKSFLYSYC